jgi:hypothetical protein
MRSIFGAALVTLCLLGGSAAHAQKFAIGLSHGADRAAKFHELKQRAAAEKKTSTAHLHAMSVTKAKPQKLGAISRLFGIQPVSH